MLKGIRPSLDKTAPLLVMTGFDVVSVKSREQQYVIPGRYKDVCRQVVQELPGKPSRAASSEAETYYTFGTPTRPGYTILRISKLKENETFVEVIEEKPDTWADRVNKWWEKSRAAK
jgi:hypothetical protein